SRSGRASSSGSSSRSPPRPAICSSPCSSGTWVQRTPAACSARTAACSTGSTRSCSPRLPRTSSSSLTRADADRRDGRSEPRPAAGGDRGGLYTGSVTVKRVALLGATGSIGRQVGGVLVSLLEAAEPDVVLNAVVGFAGLPATLWTLEHGADLALANKESLV